jgi:two-component system, LuxR family, sensor kinase FixL
MCEFGMPDTFFRGSGMGKTVGEILLEIVHLQAQLDQAEQVLRTIGPELAATIPESCRQSTGLDPLRGHILEQVAEGAAALAQARRILHHVDAAVPATAQTLRKDDNTTVRPPEDSINSRKALQASEELYRRIVETAEEGIWILDDQNNTAFVNQRMARMLGYNRSEMLGKPITSFTNPQGSLQILQALQRRRQGKRETYDMSFFHKDGHELSTLVCTTPILDDDKRYAGTLKMITDITARRTLEKQVADIARREQQRIGRDLHDVLGQTLTGIAFLSQFLYRHLAAEARPEAVQMAEVVELVNQSMKQVRSLAKGLQTVPAVPDGLRMTLSEYISDVRNLYGVSCHFECESGIGPTAPEVATHLYHIAQEAILNAIKHGQATAITIRLKTGLGGGVNLEIISNGRDFPGESAKGGLGLRIMKQRTVAIGASLHIEKAPSGGTLVACSVPGTTAETEVEYRHGNATGSDQ